MNDERLDQLLNEAMKVERGPDLWPRVAPGEGRGLTWREIRWALGVGLAVLTVCWMAPHGASGPGRDWEPVALKERLRTEAMAASVNR